MSNSLEKIRDDIAINDWHHSVITPIIEVGQIIEDILTEKYHSNVITWPSRCHISVNKGDDTRITKKDCDYITISLKPVI